MPKSYTVVSGDTLTRIALRHGVPSWRNIYNAPENADFRRRRPNPDRIFPGDAVIIPDPWGAGGPGSAPPPRDQAGICVCREFGCAPPLFTNRAAPFAPRPGFAAQAVSAPALPPGPAVPPPPSPLQAALDLAPQAAAWSQVAMLELVELATIVRENADPTVREGWKGLDVCFRINSVIGKEARLARLEELRRRFALVNSAMRQATTFFVEDPARTDAHAEAPMGGIAIPGAKIKLMKTFVLPFQGQFATLQSGPIFRTTVMLHEGAHFAHRTIGHVADPTPPPQGNHVSSFNPFPGTPNWATMTADMALDNAYSYAQYCLHLEKGGDWRIVNFAL